MPTNGKVCCVNLNCSCEQERKSSVDELKKCLNKLNLLFKLRDETDCMTEQYDVICQLLDDELAKYRDLSEKYLQSKISNMMIDINQELGLSSGDMDSNSESVLGILEEVLTEYIVENI